MARIRGTGWVPPAQDAIATDEEIIAALEQGKRVLLVEHDLSIARQRLHEIVRALPGSARVRYSSLDLETINGGRLWIVTPRQTGAGRGMKVNHLVLNAPVSEEQEMALRVAVCS